MAGTAFGRYNGTVTASRIRDFAGSDAPAVARLVESVLREFRLWRGHRGKLGDLEDIPGTYLSPRGKFLVVEQEGRVIGCGGLRPRPKGVGEIRRMYLLKSARGRGLGGRVLRRLLEHARWTGSRRLVLESSRRFEAALALYRKAGFRASACEADGCCDVRMALALVPDSTCEAPRAGRSPARKSPIR